MAFKPKRQMKTTIEQLIENRGLDYPRNVFNAIADGSLIPYICDNEEEISIITCDAISGGADYINEMPASLSLTKITHDYEKQETEELFADYTKDYEPKKILQIADKTAHGKLLMTAILALSTKEGFKDKTPDNILSYLIESKHAIYTKKD